MSLFITDTGQELMNVHGVNTYCMTVGCCIHNPSDHPYVDWPLHWNQDLGRMERVSPEGFHIWDPDSEKYKQLLEHESKNGITYDQSN